MFFPEQENFHKIEYSTFFSHRKSLFFQEKADFIAFLLFYLYNRAKVRYIRHVYIVEGWLFL